MLASTAKIWPLVADKETHCKRNIGQRNVGDGDIDRRGSGQVAGAVGRDGGQNVISCRHIAPGQEERIALGGVGQQQVAGIGNDADARRAGKILHSPDDVRVCHQRMNADRGQCEETAGRWSDTKNLP